jgi:glycosyltransferase involved in cell wall biosynthesis
LTERQRVPAEHIDVVYNGVPEFGAGYDREQERSRLGIAPDSAAIVFVGSLIERKGLGELIDAVAGMERADWQLFIAGTGEDEARFEQQARHSAASQNIVFLGQVDEAAIGALLAAADLLVLPSFMEGMPYVVLEAMASSLAVVASRVNGIPEAVDDGASGLLVAPGDVAALRSSIEALLQDGQRRRDFGRAGRARFEAMFTLERHLSAMHNLYGSLRSRGGEGDSQHE